MWRLLDANELINYGVTTIFHYLFPPWKNEGAGLKNP